MRRLLTAALPIIVLFSCSPDSPPEVMLPEQVGQFKLVSKRKDIGAPANSNFSVEITLKPPPGTTSYTAQYESSGRETVLYDVLVFPTASEAEEWIKLREDKADVVERGPKLDASGRRIGRRVRQGKEGELIMVSWNEGTWLCQFSAGNQKVAAEFESSLLNSRAK